MDTINKKDFDVFRSGDLMACYGTDLPSRGISLVSSTILARPFWAASHIAGMVYINGEMKWAESTTFCKHPCDYAGEKVNGVQIHDPGLRIWDYLAGGGSVVQWRLTDMWQFELVEQEYLSDLVLKYFLRRRVRYDWDHAFFSGVRTLRLLGILPSFNENEIFCSSWWAYLYMRLHRMGKQNPGYYNPGNLIRELYGMGVIYKHKVWTPRLLVDAQNDIQDNSPKLKAA